MLTLGRLPIKEKIDYNIAKLTFQASYKENWPSYLSFRIKRSARILRSNSSGNLTLDYSQIESTFQHSSARVFNNIPISFKNMDFKGCEISLKKHFKTLSISRIRE